MNFPMSYNYMNNIPMQGYNQPIQQFNQNQQALVRVNGIEGAKAYQMQPNSIVALFDSNDDFFYLKQTDGAGFPTIRTFKFEEITNFSKNSENLANSCDFVTRKELEDYVEQYISNKSNTDSTIKQTASGND